MSFQNFRLAPPGAQHSYAEIDTPPHTSLPGSSSSLSPSFPQMSSDSSTRMHSPSSSHYADNQRKGLYGSGDADDRYTLVFESMEAFEAWRQREEEEKMVEFVKGDTHASKAVPPRFREHTKLVCGRHSRGGRKKYVKKYPDRVRKVPSRKLDGMGCPASISYKTYFDSDEVRACYVSEHSHEIGHANLPFTKRGRKAQAEMEARVAADRPRGRPRKDRPSEAEPEPSMSPTPDSFMDDSANAVAGPSSAPAPQSMPQPVPAPPMAAQQTFQSAISMLAPLPPMQPSAVDMSQERWDRMGVLFQSIRDHARSFEFPAPSVAALESVLIRLYLESPIGGSIAAGAPPQMDPMHGGVGMDGANHHGAGT